MLQTGAQVADKAVQGLLSRVDQLAEKLGTTAANVWTIYVAQARVEAIRDSLVAGVMILMALVALMGAWYCWQKYKTNPRTEYDGGGFALLLVSISFLIFFTCWAYGAVGEWLNPQFWAFQHITADIKGLL